MPITPHDIRRDQINRFLARCIAHASAVAIDAEFGINVLDVAVTETNAVRVDFDNGHILFLDFEHLVPRFSTAPV
jgi:hypothetical protein